MGRNVARSLHKDHMGPIFRDRPTWHDLNICFVASAQTMLDLDQGKSHHCKDKR